MDMARFGGPWKNKVLGLRGSWPRLLAHDSILGFEHSQSAIRHPHMANTYCVVVCHMGVAQAIIQLNNAMPMYDPFPLEVRCYMEYYGVWASYNPQHSH
jgi:hypothetical protein